MADTLPVSVAPPPRTALDSIPGLRQLLLLVGIAGAIAAAVWLVLWSQGTNYAVLYGQLSERETGQVADALASSGIQYKMQGNTILVPEEKLYQARIHLAGQGLPQSDSMGAELIQENPGFGTSQFMETARYQHALETELARTIVKVQGVQGARVHLAMPPPSAFVRDQRKPSASVMLQLYPGRRLDSGQVAAVVHMVASSVPELEARQVTVVDQNGTLLNSPDDNDAMALSAKQFEYTRQIEQSFSQRIEDLLEPLTGSDRVRARVTADMDFTQTEQTREGYDPARSVIRSEQTATDQRSAGDLAQGIPGALSNQPPGTSGVPPASQQQPVAGAQPLSSSNRATRNFEVDRTISHTRQPMGVVRKLSVAVVVDDWRRPDEEGNVTATPLNQAEIDRFTALVKEAIGFDEARGDRVNVVNSAFHTEPPPPEAEAESLLSQPWFKSMGKQIIAVVLVLLLAFVVLKPMMRTLTQPVGRGGAGGLGDDRLTLGGAPGQMMYQPNYDQQVAAARGLVGQDPKRAAEVMKEWVNG